MSRFLSFFGFLFILEILAVIAISIYLASIKQSWSDFVLQKVLKVPSGTSSSTTTAATTPAAANNTCMQDSDCTAPMRCANGACVDPSIADKTVPVTPSTMEGTQAESVTTSTPTQNQGQPK